MGSKSVNKEVLNIEKTKNITLNISINIKFYKDLTTETPEGHCENTFGVFKSMNDNLILIYSKYSNIISYDLNNFLIISEIKNSHYKYIITFRHFFDNYKKGI